MVRNIDINLGQKITTKISHGDTQPSPQIRAMYDPLGMRFFNVGGHLRCGSSDSDWSNDSAGSSWNIEQDVSKKKKRGQ